MFSTYQSGWRRIYSPNNQHQKRCIFLYISGSAGNFSSDDSWFTNTDLTMIIDQFNDTIDAWIAELQHYKFDELLVKPDAVSWSLGQVFMHVIEDTKYYMEQIAFCLNKGEYVSEKMSENAKTMFLNNEFPDKKIKGDPFISDSVQQPVNKQQLQEEMLELKQEMGLMWNRLISTNCIGKAKHPGLGYFSGTEWVQFADMHLRHHLRQKKRIDHFLRKAHD